MNNNTRINYDERRKFQDFARNERYSLARLTATLSTVLLGFSFTIISKGLNSNRVTLPLGVFRFSLFGVLVLGITNVIVVWWRIKRTIYQYYNKFAREPLKSDRMLRIEGNESKWEIVIWWSFIGCLLSFLVFIIPSLVSYLRLTN
jgi:hypothetical protein